jgi:hypothetical protein
MTELQISQTIEFTEKFRNNCKEHVGRMSSDRVSKNTSQQRKEIRS